MSAKQPLILKQEFADALNEALTWYDSKQEGLSSRLSDDVFNTLSRIKKFRHLLLRLQQKITDRRCLNTFLT